MKKTTELFDTYLANLAVITFKIHNLHWNTEGTQFIPVHLYTEEVYDETFEYFDAVAEQYKMYGAMPDCKLATYIEKATIKEEEPKKFTPDEAMAVLVEDLKILREQATELRNACDEEGWFTSVGMFEDHVASYNKRIWFLTATLAK
ncbi:MAG: DNA starvation/stationary phase protection protein [Eubacteriales bacterium]|nr:DNA starvation/stationary phase protection protein [Eubacteriales bacterium]